MNGTVLYLAAIAMLTCAASIARVVLAWRTWRWRTQRTPTVRFVEHVNRFPIVRDN